MAERKRTKRQADKRKKLSVNKMDIIILVIFVTAWVFIQRMIELFELYGTVPDSLIVAFFGFIGGECGFMALIKTSQERKQDRKWQLEDREAEQKATQHTEDTTTV